MPPSAGSNKSNAMSPRDRIIAASETLFASKGLHGTALREIAREAEVNVNLINHHFSSKNELYLQVLQTRLEEINGIRETLLEELDHRYSPGTPPVQEVLHAFVHPVFKLKAVDPKLWTNFARSYVREMGTDVWRELNALALASVMRRFTTVLHRSLPAAKRSDIVLILGMAIHSCVIAADADEAAIVGEGLAEDLLSDSDLEARLIRALSGAALQFS